MKSILVASLLCLTCMPLSQTVACSTLMAGRRATNEGSVLMSHSCDGDVMGLVYVMPAQSFSPGTQLPMYWNVPRPSTYAQYQAHLRRGFDHVGMLSVEKTYRSIVLGGNLESMTTGGLKEHGVSIAIEFLPMHEGLACAKGVVGPNSNHWTTSLIANGLLRATTAREAIRIIGSMVEQYGFLYYRGRPPAWLYQLPTARKYGSWKSSARERIGSPAVAEWAACGVPSVFRTAKWDALRTAAASVPSTSTMPTTSWLPATCTLSLKNYASGSLTRHASGMTCMAVSVTAETPCVNGEPWA